MGATKTIHCLALSLIALMCISNLACSIRPEGHLKHRWRIVLSPEEEKEVRRVQAYEIMLCPRKDLSASDSAEFPIVPRNGKADFIWDTIGDKAGLVPLVYRESGDPIPDIVYTGKGLQSESGKQYEFIIIEVKVKE